MNKAIFASFAWQRIERSATISVSTTQYTHISFSLSPPGTAATVWRTVPAPDDT
jgi:hypothetical protein